MKSLYELYGEHKGKVSDKWLGYFDVYDRILAEYQELPVQLLEIGVQNGGSLEIWGKYFRRAKVIVGCDINPDCAKLAYDDPRIRLVIGDANQGDVQAKIFENSQNFDVVIDDGSHTSEDIVRAFCCYLHSIKDGGVFIAEDLHCSYWMEYGGGLYYPFSAMAFFKRLADVINIEHVGINKTRRELICGILKRYNTNLDERDLERVHSVEFANSLCIVRVRSPYENVLGRRVIVGHEEGIAAGRLKMAASMSDAPSQMLNIWSTMNEAPDEVYELLLATIGRKGEGGGERAQGASEKFESPNVQLANLIHDFNACKREMASTKEIFEYQKTELDNLHRTLSKQALEISELDGRLLEKNQQMIALYESMSWRLTRPMRIIGGIIGWLGVWFKKFF